MPRPEHSATVYLISGRSHVQLNAQSNIAIAAAMTMTTRPVLHRREKGARNGVLIGKSARSNPFPRLWAASAHANQMTARKRVGAHARAFFSFRSQWTELPAASPNGGLAIIEQQVDKALRLVSEALDPRQNSGAPLVLERSTFDAAELIGAAAQACRPAMEGRHQTLEVTISRPLEMDGESDFRTSV
jgi:hypothetical protein